MDLQLPDRYELDLENPILGEGGMGRVLKVRDVVLDLPVAIKLVRPDLAADKRFRNLFELEVRMSARLTHPHIVPLHDVGEMPDGTPYLGLALADAGSFSNMRAEVPTWDYLLRLTLELLEALGHLHSRDVVHRDLKPENVLLFTGEDGQPHVWLADLGLANAGTDLARKKGRVEGTPGFMAPEQKLGLPREYGPWTDLFSLGVILWEIVTGELPFPAGRSPLDSELGPLVPRRGVSIPDRLELVMANLLSAEPLSRYDLAADVRTELLALGAPNLVGGKSGSSRPSGSRTGTVAPSVALITPEGGSWTGAFSRDGLSTSGLKGTGLTPVEPPVEEFQYGVPAWNRPAPKPMPENAPSETGFGATARGSIKLFALRELPLVAREEYRQLLWNAARAVADDGRSRVIILVGEAGSGKTKLVESVVHSLQAGGWCEAVELRYQHPPGKEDGYAGTARSLIRPWNETRQTLEGRLRRVLARERGALDDAVREESAALARWCGLMKEGEEPLAAGYGLREVYRHLDARSWRGLSLMLIDNAHWSAEDGDGLAICETVLHAGDTKRRRLLVVATIRAEDLGQDRRLQAQVDALVTLGAERIDLPRLDGKGTEALLRESLNLTPDLRRKLARQCLGNPLFARQLLLDWTNRGWLVDTGGLTWGLAPGVNVEEVLPKDAEALFLGRIESMAQGSGNAERCRDVLHMAALAGLAMPSMLLWGLAGTDLHSHLLASGFWVQRDDLVTFDHPLLYQAVRAQAEAREDVDDLHRRLARGFYRYGQKSGADVNFEVGLHAHSGKDWRLAVGHLLRAAEAAWQRGRTEPLDVASRLAVEACESSPEYGDRLGWARIWRARLCQVRGEKEEAGKLFAQGLADCEANNDAVGATEARIGMGWAARQSGDLAQAERLYSDAMKKSRTSDDRRLEAQAISGLAWVEQQKRNFEGADILFTRVLNRFQQLGDQRGIAESCLGQAFVARRTGSFDDAEDLYEEARNAFQAGDDPVGMARALQGHAQVARQRLDIDKADKLFGEAIEIAEELGATELLMECRLGMAEVHRIRGDYDRARKAYDDHRRWSERQGVFEGLIFAELGLAQVALLEQDLEALYHHSQRAAEVLNKVPGHWLWAPYRLIVAAMLALRGDEDQTYRWLWSASELGLADTVDQDIAFVLTRICTIAARQRWGNVMRVAGKLACSQWERLGRADKAAKVREQARAVLGGPA